MHERQYTASDIIQWLNQEINFLKKESSYGAVFLITFWIGIATLIISLTLGFIGYNDFKHVPKVISFFTNFIGPIEPDFSNCDIFDWGIFCCGGFPFVKYHKNVIVDELRLEHIPMQIQNYGGIFFGFFIWSMTFLGCSLIFQIICASWIAGKSWIFEALYETNIKKLSIITIFLGMFTASILERKIWKTILENQKPMTDSNNPFNRFIETLKQNNIL